MLEGLKYVVFVGAALVALIIQDHRRTPVNRNDCILHALQTGEQTTSQLALICDSPEPSVRRSIQELRRDGYNISFAGAPTYIYRMGV